MKSDSKTLDENRFFDTNLFVYAYTEPNSEKGKRAQKLLIDVFEGRAKGVLSNQVLAELSYVLLSKFETDPEKVDVIVSSIRINANWRRLEYSTKTVAKCVKAILHTKTRFFDTLIAETMRENEINMIITENTKDFERINGMTTVNPFR